ncbi:hypothetical protein P5673_000071 [Acropora cervicornis]|uniref:Uncharacterized protein n=1 Tax=Acropora cervicornis TaxID=6130 RepID=A0AAD9VGU5_ACRCE|nr:hypothetical protein P5673_000071 [Acropora cervicornis]
MDQESPLPDLVSRLALAIDYPDGSDGSSLPEGKQRWNTSKSAPLARNWIPGPLPGIWTIDKEEVLNKIAVHTREEIHLCCLV